MFLVSILLRQCWYLDCWFYLILLILWWKVLMVPLKVPLIYMKYFLFIFPSFREHAINVCGSHIRHRIIIIRTGVVVRDVITYHEVNSLAIIWNTVWNVWNTAIVVCDGVPIDCIDMVSRKAIDIFWCIVLWYVWIFLDVLLSIWCSG